MSCFDRDEQEEKPAPWLADLIIGMSVRRQRLATIRCTLRDDQEELRHELADMEDAMLETIRDLIANPPKTEHPDSVYNLLTQMAARWTKDEKTTFGNNLPLHTEEYSTIITNVNEKSEGENLDMVRPVLKPVRQENPIPGVIRLKIDNWHTLHTILIETDRGDISVCKCQWNHPDLGQTFAGRGIPQRCPFCKSRTWTIGEYQYKSERYIHSPKERPCPDTT